jgi:type IV pilus assembly protein PilX
MGQRVNTRLGYWLRRRTQRGLSLIVTMIALVVLAFAGIALLRSVDTGTLIAGNLGFQETALASADAGTEAAVAWLQANFIGTGLFTDVSASGYYATTSDNCDLTGNKVAGSTNDVNWTGTDPGPDCNMNARILAANTAGVAPGYTVAYVINRICNAPGDPNAALAADGTTPMVCSRYKSGLSDGSSTRIGASYGSAPLDGGMLHYYRITTRVSGPRSTVRFIQAFVVL